MPLEIDLEVICLKCLEKDPRHRYSTAQALAEDLENWMAGRPVKARPPGAARRTLRWTKRNPVGAAFIVTLALGLFAALVLLRIVVHQRNQIAFDRDQTFEEGMNRISLIWADDATREIDPCLADSSAAFSTRDEQTDVTLPIDEALMAAIDLSRTSPSSHAHTGE